MPRRKRVVHETKVRGYREEAAGQSLLARLQSQINLDQSYLSLFLGVLIVIVAGVLIFNYFQKGQQSLGPAQQTANNTTIEPQKDVEPGNLPGKYTVKDGDTLFQIADKYYGDGYQYPAIAKANQLASADVIEVGQVLSIPKLEVTSATGPTNPVTAGTIDANSTGTGGAENQTIWGERITGNTYTVQEGDWLSTIAGRAYGDIYAFDKIAKANNIADPNVIEPGTVLQIPR